MHRACHRVFRDAKFRSKKTADKIDAQTGSGYADAAQTQLSQLCEVWRNGTNHCFAIEYGDIVVGSEDFDGMPTKPFDQCYWRRTWLWRAGGKAHCQQAVPALDSKHSATGFKCNHPFRVAKNLKDDMG